MKLDILNDLDEEIHRIDGGQYGRPYASSHEFMGVLFEEVDELWHEVKKHEKDYDLEAQYKEGIQCMAVIYRYLRQITSE